MAVSWDGEARGVLSVADTVKPTSAEAITRLRALGLIPVLLTGDNATVAVAAAAREVGIYPDHVHADLGLSMGTGSDVAIQASDLTLVRSD